MPTALRYGGVCLGQRVKTRCYKMGRAYGSGQCAITEMITALVNCKVVERVQVSSIYNYL